MPSRAALLAMPLLVGHALGGCGSDNGRSGLDGVAAIFEPILAALRPASASPTNAAGYRDDSLAIPPSARTVKVRGDIGLKPYKLPPQPPGPLFLDLRDARFTLTNSRNASPTPQNRCDKGDLPINNNPISIVAVPDATVVGGLVQGAVPQDSDWRSTYCNSTAVQFRDSPRGTVDGIRISRAWDGIRVGRASDNFLLRNSWLSQVRDDAIENDRLHSGRIEDSLFDGTLQGMAMRPNAKSTIGPTAGLVEINGSLIRLKEHRSDKGRWSLGSLVKNDPRAPRISLSNNVIALDADNIDHWSDSWPITWSKLAGASNNLVLWLSDKPMPAGWEMPSQGFKLLRGPAARSAWSQARQNWIDCHPKLARFPGDPLSNFARCRPRTWGGYSR